MENTKKLTFLDESQTSITSTETTATSNSNAVKAVEQRIDEITKIVTICEDVWNESNATQIQIHAAAFKKLIRESAIVPSENQESICGGLKDALNTKL